VFLQVERDNQKISVMRGRKIAIFASIAVVSLVGLFEIRGCLGIPTVSDSEAKTWFPVGMSSDDAITALESHGFSADRVQYGKEMQVQGDKSIDQFLFLIDDRMHITVHLDDRGRVWQADTDVSRITP
jgi:hypothetical protein